MKNLEDEILDIKNRSRLDYVSFDQKIDSIKEHYIYKRLYNICIDSNIKTFTTFPLTHLDKITFACKNCIKFIEVTTDSRSFRLLFL